MFSARYLMIAFTGFMLLQAGCTRPEEEVSKVSFVLPKSSGSGKAASQSLSATDKLAHVIINVSGNGINSPIVYQWDMCHECIVQPDPPSSFDLEVPMGSERLVQVLAVYKDSATSGMSIYYGDQQPVDMTSTSVSVVIPLLGLSTSDNLTSVSSRIAGRYFSQDGSTPTGEVYIRFDPGAGKQKLIVEKSKIVAGWFQFFALDNVNFEYYIPSKDEKIFGEAVNSNSSVFNTSTRVVRGALPRHYRGENYGGGTTVWTEDEPGYFIWGYFGAPGSISGKSAWLASVETTGSMSKLKVMNGGGAQGSLLTVSSAAIAAKSTLISTSTPTHGIAYLNGGTASNSGSLFEDYIPVTKSLIDGQGNDFSAGFVVPFQWHNRSNYQLFNISDGGSGKIIAGTVLPGVPSVIAKFIAFKKVGVGMNYRQEFGSCTAIRNGQQGWQPAGDGSSNNGDINPGTRTFAIATNVTSSESAAGVAVALCGVSSSGVVFESAGILNPYHFSSGGGVPDHVQLSFMTPYETMMPASTCVSFSFQVSAANSAFTTATAATTVSLEYSADNGSTWNNSSFYNYQTDCNGTSNPQSSMTFSTGESQKMFYGSFSGTTLKFRAVAASLPNTAPWTSVNYSVLGSSNPILKLMAPQSIFQGVCYPVTLDYRQISGSPESMIGEPTFSLSPGNAGIYSDSGCITSITSLSAGPNYLNAYMKVTGLPTNQTMLPIYLSAPAYTNKDVSSVRVTHDPAVAQGFAINTNPGMRAGDCYFVDVQLVGAQMTPIPASATTAFTLGTSGGFAGKFYYTSGCSGTANNSISANFAAGEYKKSYYFKPFAVHGVSSPALQVSGSGLTTGQTPINNYTGLMASGAVQLNSSTSGSLCSSANFALRLNDNSTIPTVNSADGWILDLSSLTLGGACLGVQGVYTDSSCVTPLTPTNSVAGFTGQSIYIKANAAGTACSLGGVGSNLGTYSPTGVDFNL